MMKMVDMIKVLRYFKKQYDAGTLIKPMKNCKTCYGKRGAILKSNRTPKPLQKPVKIMKMVDMIKVL